MGPVAWYDEEDLTLIKEYAKDLYKEWIKEEAKKRKKHH